MLINISDNGFKKIFNNKQFELPIRWTGGNFAQFLENLYDSYLNNLCKNSKDERSKSFSYFKNETRYW